MHTLPKQARPPSLTKVASECLDAPGHVAGVADGRKRAQALEHARVLEGDCERAVASHAVACCSIAALRVLSLLTLWVWGSPSQSVSLLCCDAHKVPSEPHTSSHKSLFHTCDAGVGGVQLWEVGGKQGWQLLRVCMCGGCCAAGRAGRSKGQAEAVQELGGCSLLAVAPYNAAQA